MENDLATSRNKLTDREMDPESDEQQQSHDYKQHICSKGLSENSKEKGDTNSVLDTDSVTVPKQGHKQSRSKNSLKVKGKVGIPQQMRQ